MEMILALYHSIRNRLLDLTSWPLTNMVGGALPRPGGRFSGTNFRLKGEDGSRVRLTLTGTCLFYM